LGGFQGQATDIEIHAKEIINLKRRLNSIYVKHTEQKLAIIEKSVERDTFMSPQEAKSFGLIDEIVDKRPTSPQSHGEDKKKAA
jgi:ATP-dependent Clp protease protease subunit